MRKITTLFLFLALTTLFAGCEVSFCVRYDLDAGAKLMSCGV